LLPTRRIVLIFLYLCLARIADESEGLGTALGPLGADATAVGGRHKPRQHDLFPTPSQGCFFPQSSRTYSTVSMSEYTYVFALILIARGLNGEFQVRAEAAVRRAAPDALYRQAPCKTFPRVSCLYFVARRLFCAMFV
jgi:hypothetical protein